MKPRSQSRGDASPPRISNARFKAMEKILGTVLEPSAGHGALVVAHQALKTGRAAQLRQVEFPSRLDAAEVAVE